MTTSKTKGTTVQEKSSHNAKTKYRIYKTGDNHIAVEAKNRNGLNAGIKRACGDRMTRAERIVLVDKLVQTFKINSPNKRLVPGRGDSFADLNKAVYVYTCDSEYQIRVGIQFNHDCKLMEGIKGVYNSTFHWPATYLNYLLKVLSKVSDFETSVKLACGDPVAWIDSDIIVIDNDYFQNSSFMMLQQYVVSTLFHETTKLAIF